MTLLISLLPIIFGFGTEPLDTFPGDWPNKSDTVKVWNIVADRISTDPLGQFYILSGGSLVKYASNGDSAYSWSEPSSGPITMFDTGDPMRILIYKKDFNLLRFLNNRLAPLTELIRLDDLGLSAPLALAVSRRGGFWVLDGSTCRIKLIDQLLKPVVESAPLNIATQPGVTGYRMIESGDQIYLLIPGKEIQVFDQFANLVKKTPVRIPSFNVYGNQILFIYPDKISIWKDQVTPEEILFSSPGADIREGCLFQNKLLIRTPVQVILITR